MFANVSIWQLLIVLVIVIAITSIFVKYLNKAKQEA